MAIINNSEDKLNVKTYMIRDKASPRAVVHLRRAIEYARHVGSEKHETTPDQFDVTKDMDIDAEGRQERRRAERAQASQEDNLDMDTKSIKECTFRDYLIELEISDDPIQGRIDAQKAARNPEVYRKEQLKKNIEDKRDVMQDKDDPHAAEKARILQRKIQTQKDEERLAKKQEQGAARPMVGMSS